MYDGQEVLRVNRLDCFFDRLSRLPLESELGSYECARKSIQDRMALTNQGGVALRDEPS